MSSRNDMNNKKVLVEGSEVSTWFGEVDKNRLDEEWEKLIATFSKKLTLPKQTIQDLLGGSRATWEKDVKTIKQTTIEALSKDKEFAYQFGLCGQNECRAKKNALRNLATIRTEETDAMFNDLMVIYEGYLNAIISRIMTNEVVRRQVLVTLNNLLQDTQLVK